MAYFRSWESSIRTPPGQKDLESNTATGSTTVIREVALIARGGGLRKKCPVNCRDLLQSMVTKGILLAPATGGKEGIISLPNQTYRRYISGVMGKELSMPEEMKKPDKR